VAKTVEGPSGSSWPPVRCWARRGTNTPPGRCRASAKDYSDTLVANAA
jgi:hypothetical protein